MKVLLLNPPSPAGMGLVLRDYACGESVKADYYWAPIDLLVLSGVLRPHHDVHVLDAVAEGLDRRAALGRVDALAPDVIFSLTAAVSLDADDDFLARAKARTGARVYAMGDVASFAPEATLARTEAMDGLVQNFADPSLGRLVDSETGETGALSSVVLRRTGRHPIRELDPMRYALPLHERFPLHRYRMPFTPWDRSTSILTAYGCPFPCTFCASRNLPGQQRPLDDVLDELNHIHALGVREVYVRDFTYGPTRKRARALSDRIAAAGLDLRLSAECRMEVLDEPTLDAMRAAGFEVILVGLEAGDTDVAKSLGKRAPGDRTRRILEHARRIGIRTCAHFVLGSPGEQRDQILSTIRMARDMPLDYASFNLYAPRLGTTLRDELVAAGRVAEDDFAGQDVSLRAGSLAAVDQDELRALFRRAILSFYLRPRQVTRLLRHTPWSTLARQGTGVLRVVVRAS